MGFNRSNYQGIMALPINYDPKMKEVNSTRNVRYMLSRSRRMFKWGKLPKTIPERQIELMLQTNGHVCIAKHEGKLYAFVGSFSGEPNEYYLPTQYVVANPYLKFSKTFTIGVDCVVITNDTMYMGLLPLFSKYCTLIAETELTMYEIAILARAALIFDAEDESEVRNIEEFIRQLKNGDLSVIGRESLMAEDGIRVQPGATASAQVLTHLIEVLQYFKAAQFNEIGLNANWNAKRETITSSETLLNSDTLLPLCDDMIECRRLGIEQVKELFGEEWEVEFNSSWQHNEFELEMTEEKMEAEIDAILNEDEEKIDEEVEVEDEKEEDGGAEDDDDERSEKSD